jgi:flagella basal body P-ring formation protein FlgA
MKRQVTENRRAAAGGQNGRRTSDPSGWVVPAALLFVTLIVWISTALGQEAGAPRIESTDAIRAAAESFVRSQLPPDASIAAVTAGALDSRLRLVRCAAGMHGHLPPGASLQARAMVGVTCEGPVRWTVYVPVTVESRISVLVLKHPVPRDARLTIEDVTVESRKVTGLGATAFLTDVKDLQSRSAERPLPMGTTLTVDMLKPDMVIRHGQDVTLVASASGIEVRAAGRALGDGATGARLKVQNLSSLKVVEGVVEGPDVVRVAQ